MDIDMDFFGIARVTVRVTRLPGRKAAAQHAAPAGAGAASSTSAAAEPVVSGPAAPPVSAESSWPPPAPARSATPADREAVIRSLISLADDMAGLADRASGESTGDRALRLAQWRVDQILAECGVQAVTDEGPVDPGRHEVVGSRPTGADGTAGWIAATIRRGYLADGQLIRPQQVVAYAADTTGTAEGSDHAGRG
jgi:hypothetical protein